MTIKTKYNIADTVYYNNFGNICSDKIASIEIYVSNGYKRVVYNLSKPGISVYNGEGGNCPKLDEENVFSSKEKLY